MVRTIEETQVILDDKVRKGNIPLYIPEILEFVGELKSRKDKIETLRNNNSVALREILRLTYSDEVEWIITPAYAKEIEFHDMDINDYPLAPSTLYREFKRLNIFTTERGSNLRESKINILLSQMYSSLYEPEIKLIQAMVTRKLPYNGVTEKLVRETFPNLLPDVKSKEVKDED